jgi:hypothetical protein
MSLRECSQVIWGSTRGGLDPLGEDSFEDWQGASCTQDVGCLGLWYVNKQREIGRKARLWMKAGQQTSLRYPSHAPSGEQSQQRPGRGSVASVHHGDVVL